MPISSAASPERCFSLKSVLVASDFSEASQKALRHALAVARHFGAKFYLAHVVSGVGYTLAGPQATALACERAERDLLQLEHDLVESGSLDGIDHEFIVREGAVWAELRSIISQNQIDLVLLGASGRRGLGKMLLGSVAEDVFRHASCPVLTVGPNSYPFDFGKTSPRFLFATDFGDGSLRALPHAISFANHLRAKLTLLHVVPITPVPKHPTSDVLAIRDSARMACVRQLEQLLGGEEELVVPPEFIVRFGLPSEKILEEALELKADLIFMGLHPSTHVADASHMPWATAYDVVCCAGCPVLTVRAQ